VIIYRTATVADLPALAELRWEHWAEDARDPAIASRADFRREFVVRIGPRMEGGQLTVWVAEWDGEIIANMYVQRVAKVPKPSKLDDGYGYVTNVHTRSAYRNQGIGGELLRHVQAWAHEHDLEFLVLWPGQRSVPFYARAGFHPGEAIEFEVRPYVG
jgi:GNAT superfamily N-acetyltransferase